MVLASGILLSGCKQTDEPIVDSSEIPPEEITSAAIEVSLIPGSGPSYPADINDYLREKAREMNLPSYEDAGGNLVIEKPAAEGFEYVPPVVIETSTASASGQGILEIDYESNRIYTHSESIDAPRNLGIATNLAILKNAKNCGGISAVFINEDTSNPAGGGATAFSAKGAPYLVGFCGTNGIGVYTSSPAAELLQSYKPLALTQPKGQYAYVIVAEGFPETLNGYDISPVDAISRIFAAAGTSGVYFELASFEAASLPLTVPNTAVAVVVLDEYEKKKFSSVFKAVSKDYTKSLPDGYDSVRMQLIDTRVPSAVLSDESTDSVVAYLYALFNSGKNSEDQLAAAKTKDQTTGNYPVCVNRLSLSAGEFRSQISISGDDEQTSLEITQQQDIGEFTGMTIEKTGSLSGYKTDKDGDFATGINELLKATASDTKGFIKLKTPGELGQIKANNPEAEMLSLGWDVQTGTAYNEFVSLKDVEAPAEAVIDFIYRLAATQ
ncbi:MAG: hypothetical protein LBK04_07495 [Clostridiales Family XIII bacterium]|nr:hypothetical protein [Clostridiales Family XIII bacterium]